MAQISYGTITITDTNDIERIYVVYAKHTSNTDSSGLPAAANWKESIAEAPGSGNYIWQRIVVKKSGITTLTYGNPVCVTGPQGIQGPTGPEGDDATNITDIQVQYGISANWNTQPSSWSNNSPDYDSTKPNYWTRTRLVYEDGTYSDWIVSQDHASTEAIAQAVSANSIAQDANENAQDALSQATEAQQLVTHIDNLLGGHFLWHGNALSQATPSGARVVERIKDGSTDVSNTPSKWLHNVNIGANGISLRYNEATMAQLAANQSSSANTALKFYQPPTVNGNTTTQGNLAMELSGSALKFYDSTGTIAQATFGGNKAVISGTINVIDGQIGNSANSYWYIGNYLDYQQNNSAAIKSYGTAFIQLGNSLTWRVATNRIHSAWNNDNSSGDAFRLHFPSYYNKNQEEKYWDVGLHLPQSINDKFLYVRNAAKTETLENLNNDLEDSGYNYWEYQFWVDGAGNVHAPGFFIGNSTTPIGGGAGTVAERLTQGYGSATQPIYFNSSGVPTNTTHALNAAGAKGVVTDLASNTTSTDLPTAASVVNYVTSRGYITSFTDKNVQTNLASDSSTFYIAGPTSTATTTGTLKVITDAKVTVDGNSKATITATSFVGSLTGTASRATADSDGNVIKSTYLKLSGGNVTGAVTFGSSVSADELTAGDLVVNGNASFTNNAQFNTINGIVVGSSPKFTDVNVTQTATTTSAAYEVLFSYTADNTTRTEGTRKTSTLTYNPSTKELTVGTVKIKEASTGFTISGGTTSKTLTVGGDYTLAAAAAKGVVTTIDTSANLPTSNAVKTFVENKGYVTSSGVTTVTAGDGLDGGGTTAQVTLKTNLRSFTKLTNDSTAATETSGRIYPIVLDKSGYLAVNVPWTNVNSNYLTSSSTLNWNNVTSNRPTTLSGYGITDAKIANGVITLGSNTISKMPNPNALTIKVYNANTATAQGSTYSPTEVSYDGSASGKIASVAGTNAITNISASAASGGSSTFTVVKADGSSSTFNVNISGAVVSGATILTNSSGVGLDVDGPVYFDGGTPKTMKPSTSTGLFLKDDGTWATPSAAGSATNATYATYDASEASNTTKTTIADKYIPKSIGTAAGDIIYWSASGTPTRLAKGSNGQVLKLANGVPAWGTDNNNNTWRAIQVNGTDILGTGTNTNKLNLKAGSNVTITNDSGTVTIASSYTNTDTKMTQAYSTTNNSYPLLMTATAGVSSTSSRGDTTAILNNAIYANPSTGMITTFGLTAKKVNNFITGSGTAASDKGSGVSPRYFPAKWTFNIGSTLTDGDIITIKVPVAGHTYGVYLSIDNGTTYKPIVLNGTGRLTTHYGVNTYITLVYESTGSAASIYAVDGGDATTTITGGAWRVINYYDSNSNTIPQAQCETAAATAAKTASMTYYTATANRYVMVNIRYANTSQTALTLNINSTGAKPIYINGSASSTSNYTLPAGSYLVFYNGTNYYFRTDNIITGNITGNAATATTATNVAWSGITSNPITFNSTAYGTTGWSQLGGRTNPLSSIRVWKPTDTVAWGTQAHSAVIAFGYGDTKGMLDCAYGSPLVSIAGGNVGGSTDAAPKWYFKFSATSGATYTLPAASKTLAATDGTGASGTWGISISGTAAKATADKNGNDITTKYVTIDTDQTITASQKTFNGAIRWGTASKYGAVNYNSTLDALVFSFA